MSILKHTNNYGLTLYQSLFELPTYLKHYSDDMVIIDTNLADHGQRIARMENIISTVSSQNIEDLQSRLGALENKVQTNTSNIHELNDNMSDVEGRLTTDENNISSAVTRITTVEGRVTTLEDCCVHVQDRLTATELATSKNADDISGIMTRLTRDEANIQGNSDDIVILSEQVATNAHNIDDLTHALGDLDPTSNLEVVRQVAENTTAIGQLQALTTVHTQRLDGFATRFTQDEVRITDLERRMTEAESALEQVGDWQTQIDTLTDSVNDLVDVQMPALTTLVNGYDDRITALETWKVTVDTYMSDTDSVLTAYDGRLDALESADTLIEGRLSSAESDIAVIQQTITTDEAALTALTDRVSDVEDEIGDTDISTYGNTLTSAISEAFNRIAGLGTTYLRKYVSGDTDWITTESELIAGNDNKAMTASLMRNGRGFVTPEQFGAVGDGVTDDSTAFTSAMSRARALDVPLLLKGTYYLDSVITTLWRVKIEGTTVFNSMQSSSFPQPCIIAPNGFKVDYYTTIKGVKFKTYGIEIIGSRVNIEDCCFDRCTTSIHIHNTQHNWQGEIYINHCYFLECGKGVYSTFDSTIPSTDNHVLDCIFKDGDKGIVGSMHGWIISRNHIYTDVSCIEGELSGTIVTSNFFDTPNIAIDSAIHSMVVVSDNHFQSYEAPFNPTQWDEQSDIWVNSFSRPSGSTNHTCRLLFSDNIFSQSPIDATLRAKFEKYKYVMNVESHIEIMFKDNDYTIKGIRGEYVDFENDITWNVEKVTALPTATETILGATYLYMGASTQTLIHGGIYECNEVTPATDPATYEWTLISADGESLANGINGVYNALVTFQATVRTDVDALDGRIDAIEVCVPSGAGVNNKFATKNDVLLPKGMIVPYGGNSAPTGWLMCDGSAVSRDTYSELFSVIGTAFGNGDGSTTFNLPDLRNKTTFGVGNATGGLANVGDASVGSLPNVSGNGIGGRITVRTTNMPETNGALKIYPNDGGQIGLAVGNGNTDWATAGWFDIDASRVSNIYKSTTQVVPASVGVNYIIRA